MKRRVKVIILLLVAVLIFWMGALSLNKESAEVEELNLNQESTEEEKLNQEEETFTQVDEKEDLLIDLGYGMYITKVGAYAGFYMEDGSDEVVSGIMTITVKNEGEESIQYAEISVPAGEQNALFCVSTLTPGSSVILLEKNRMTYEKRDYTTAEVQNVAIFQEPLSLCEDQLKIQVLDGACNVTNISGKDIEGDITLYYKNYLEDIFYGGITYRARIEGGMKKNEIRQITADYLSKASSRLMFVTCGDK